MPEDERWVAYASTILWIGHTPGIKVDLREPIAHDLQRLLTNLGLGAAFAVVTPFDPRGAPAPAAENEARYLGTQRELTSRKLRFVPADGESPDATHRERGFAIAMARDDAAVLARELEQLALYWFDGEAFWIDGALVTRGPQRLP